MMESTTAQGLISQDARPEDLRLPDAAPADVSDVDDHCAGTPSCPPVTLPNDLTLTPGEVWYLNGEQVDIQAVPSLDHALVRKSATGEVLEVRREQLVPAPVLREAPLDPHHARYSEADLAWAREVADLLAPYVATTRLSLTAGSALGERLGVSRRTLRRWLTAYRAVGDCTAFLDRPRGLKSRQHLLSPEVEALITFHIDEALASAASVTVRGIYDAIAAQCAAVGKKPPARNTIQARINTAKADANRFPAPERRILKDRQRLVRGSLEPAGALDIVQMDHTLVDVHVNDALQGRDVGRPWLTVALDVRTRIVLGFCLTLDSPSRLSVALCLKHAVFPKEAWLERIGARGPYPVFGRMACLHCDNGADFTSPWLHRAADRNHIRVVHRPPYTPRYGGHVERWFGTLMRRARLLPGATFNDMLRLRSPYPQQRAKFTLASLELWIANEITAYHHEFHRTLGMSPLEAWTQAWSTPQGLALPAYPRDERRFFLDFLPGEARTVTREGILWNGLKFRSEALRPYVKDGIRQPFRYDPRDVSTVYFEPPEGEHLLIPWTNPTWPALSLWEWNEIKPRHAGRDTTAIASTVHAARASNRRLIEGRSGKSQRARRRLAREAGWRTPEEPPPRPDNRLQVSTASLESPVPFEVLE